MSDFGRVKSLKFGRERILKPGWAHSGYLFVMLCAGGQNVMRKVHQLVAETFLDKPDGDCDVNHIDGDRRNNQAVNLEWTTRKVNV